MLILRAWSVVYCTYYLFCRPCISSLVVINVYIFPLVYTPSVLKIKVVFDSDTVFKT
jgi:hypothetical protein